MWRFARPAAADGALLPVVLTALGSRGAGPHQIAGAVADGGGSELPARHGLAVAAAPAPHLADAWIDGSGAVIATLAGSGDDGEVAVMFDGAGSGSDGAGPALCALLGLAAVPAPAPADNVPPTILVTDARSRIVRAQRLQLVGEAASRPWVTDVVAIAASSGQVELWCRSTLRADDAWWCAATIDAISLLPAGCGAGGTACLRDIWIDPCTNALLLAFDTSDGATSDAVVALAPCHLAISGSGQLRVTIAPATVLARGRVWLPLPSAACPSATAPRTHVFIPVTEAEGEGDGEDDGSRSRASSASADGTAPRASRSGRSIPLAITPPPALAAVFWAMTAADVAGDGARTAEPADASSSTTTAHSGGVGIPTVWAWLPPAVPLPAPRVAAAAGSSGGTGIEPALPLLTPRLPVWSSAAHARVLSGTVAAPPACDAATAVITAPVLAMAPLQHASAPSLLLLLQDGRLLRVSTPTGSGVSLVFAPLSRLALPDRLDAVTSFTAAGPCALTTIVRGGVRTGLLAHDIATGLCIQDCDVGDATSRASLRAPSPLLVALQPDDEAGTSDSSGPHTSAPPAPRRTAIILHTARAPSQSAHLASSPRAWCAFLQPRSLLRLAPPSAAAYAAHLAAVYLASGAASDTPSWHARRAAAAAFAARLQATAPHRATAWSPAHVAAVAAWALHSRCAGALPPALTTAAVPAASPLSFARAMEGAAAAWAALTHAAPELALMLAVVDSPGSGALPAGGPKQSLPWLQPQLQPHILASIVRVLQAIGVRRPLLAAAVAGDVGGVWRALAQQRAGSGAAMPVGALPAALPLVDATASPLTLFGVPIGPPPAATGATAPVPGAAPPAAVSVATAPATPTARVFYGTEEGSLRGRASAATAGASVAPTSTAPAASAAASRASAGAGGAPSSLLAASIAAAASAARDATRDAGGRAGPRASLAPAAPPGTSLYAPPSAAGSGAAPPAAGASPPPAAAAPSAPSSASLLAAPAPHSIASYDAGAGADIDAARADLEAATAVTAAADRHKRLQAAGGSVGGGAMDGVAGLMAALSPLELSAASLPDPSAPPTLADVHPLHVHLASGLVRLLALLAYVRDCMRGAAPPPDAADAVAATLLANATRSATQGDTATALERTGQSVLPTLLRIAAPTAVAATQAGSTNASGGQDAHAWRALIAGLAAAGFPAVATFAPGDARRRDRAALPADAVRQLLEAALEPTTATSSVALPPGLDLLLRSVWQVSPLHAIIFLDALFSRAPPAIQRQAPPSLEAHVKLAYQLASLQGLGGRGVVGALGSAALSGAMGGSAGTYRRLGFGLLLQQALQALPAPLIPRPPLPAAAQVIEGAPDVAPRLRLLRWMGHVPPSIAAHVSLLVGLGRSVDALRLLVAAGAWDAALQLLQEAEDLEAQSQPPHVDVASLTIPVTLDSAPLPTAAAAATTPHIPPASTWMRTVGMVTTLGEVDALGLLAVDSLLAQPLEPLAQLGAASRVEPREGVATSHSVTRHRHHGGHHHDGADGGASATAMQPAAVRGAHGQSRVTQALSLALASAVVHQPQSLLRGHFFTVALRGALEQRRTDVLRRLWVRVPTALPLPSVLAIIRSVLRDGGVGEAVAAMPAQHVLPALRSLCQHQRNILAIMASHWTLHAGGGGGGGGGAMHGARGSVAVGGSSTYRGVGGGEVLRGWGSS